jgi:hypothetical protein
VLKAVFSDTKYVMRVSEGWKGAWSDYGNRCEGRTHRPTNEKGSGSVKEVYGDVPKNQIYGTLQFNYDYTLRYDGAHNYTVVTTPRDVKFTDGNTNGEGFNNALLFGGDKLYDNRDGFPTNEVTKFGSQYNNENDWGKAMTALGGFLDNKAKDSSAIMFRDDHFPTYKAERLRGTVYITKGRLNGVWADLRWGSGGALNFPVFTEGTLYLNKNSVPEYDTTSRWKTTGNKFPK